MFNIAQIQQTLQKLPDQALQQEMKGGSAPQYLVLAEIQRRQKMRQSAAQAGPAAQAPHTTVADDVMQGVAGLPGMATSEAPPGGVASFAGGGKVQSFQDRIDNSDGKNIYSDAAWPGVWETLQRMDLGGGRTLGNLDDRVGASQQANDGIGKAIGFALKTPANAAVNTLQYLGIAPGKSDYGNVDDDIGASQQWLLDKMGRGAPPVKDGAYPDPAAVRNSKAPTPTVTVTGKPDPDADADDPTGAGKGVANFGYKPGIPGGYGIGKYRGTHVDVPDMPDMPERPTESSPTDFLEMVKAAHPDLITPLMEKTAKRIEDNKARKEDVVNHALMMAGLGMMASKSPNFLQGVGEGGIMGLKQYTEGQKDIIDRGDKLEGNYDQLALAKDAAARGDFKTAADLSTKKDTWNAHLYGTDVQNYRFAQQARHAAQATNLQADKMDQDLDIKRAELGLKDKQIGVMASHYARSAKNEADQLKMAKFANTIYKAEYDKAYAGLKNDMNNFGMPEEQLRAKAHEAAIAKLTPLGQGAIGTMMQTGPIGNMGTPTMNVRGRMSVDGTYNPIK